MDVVTEHPCDVVPVGALDHLLQAQGLLVDVLDLRSWVGPAQGGVGLLDGVLCDGVDPVIVKGKELVEVTAHHLHQIIVADTRPMRTPVLRPGGQIVAHQIPVFFPLSVVDGAAGAHSCAAAGAVGDAAEDAVAEGRVCAVGLGRSLP